MVGVPELGIQNGPTGSAGSQPVAGTPAVEKCEFLKLAHGDRSGSRRIDEADTMANR